MEKLQILLAKLKATDDAIDAVLAHDSLTEAQQAEHDRLQAERKATVAAIGREKDRLAREQERQQLATEAESESRRQAANPGSHRRTTPDTPTVPATPKAKTRKLANGVEVEERWVNDPRKGFDTHVDFLRAVMNAGRTGRVDSRLKPLAMEKRASEDGDYDGESGDPFNGYLVPKAFTPNGPRKLALFNAHGKQLTAGSDEAGTYSDPYGGFLTGKDFRPELLRIDPEGDPMGQFTTKVPMQAATVGIPARVDKNHASSVSGGLRVYRRAETQTVSPSRMELEEVELKASALFGVSYATEELLARSLISFLAILQAGFSDEFNAKLVQERLEGTGVGMYEGVLNTPCTISVSKVSGQSADTIVKENVDQMRSRCWGYGSSIWLANHDTLPQLRSLVQAVGTGGAPVAYFTVDANGNAMLDGRPLFFTEFCPKLGDTGDLLLGNWKEYLEGELTPLQNEESMHVRFLEHERCFKFWTENAGRCWWRSALTPKKSAQTLSPFVKLEAR